MGNARRRGSYEARKAAAQKAGRYKRVVVITEDIPTGKELLKKLEDTLDAIVEERTKRGKQKKGLAAMSKERRQEIARKGNRRLRELGLAHQQKKEAKDEVV